MASGLSARNLKEKGRFSVSAGLQNYNHTVIAEPDGPQGNAIPTNENKKCLRSLRARYAGSQDSW